MRSRLSRLRLYQATTKYISVVLTNFHPKLEDLFEFRSATAEADFLFGPDIRAYLDELYQHGVELRRWAIPGLHTAHATWLRPQEGDRWHARGRALVRRSAQGGAPTVQELPEPRRALGQMTARPAG